MYTLYFILTFIKKSFASIFAKPAESELEEYLSTQEIHSQQDLEYQMKRFDDRKRTLSSHIAKGNMVNYAFEKNHT